MEKTKRVITTYGERHLHASLKARYCPREELHEVEIGRYVADACCDGVIYEIQTGSLAPLTKKIRYYLESTDYRVVVVRPIARNRRLFWLDAGSGECARSPRLSPRHESICNGISDLYYVSELLGEERVSFLFVIMEIDEVRLLDGYGKGKRIRATSVDRLAGEIYDEIVIGSRDDVAEQILPLLPEGRFGREELSRALGLSSLSLWSAQKLLLSLGIIKGEREGKRIYFEKLK